ncbi:LCP family protein [Corynebacterium tapiri]|uniref:LytR family transcriptional regulator n=1 Tax=Corynebacterium tapiri TaxID=1448266 RepID=A0A5C4U4E3_9CORY|nr:LCP family protein [Corynebacterium tapiri]TNL98431.1 LytR family transcriptional regulator [Corynebacterium tapiri]
MTDHRRYVRDIQPAPRAARSLRQHGPAPIKVGLTVLSAAVLAVSGIGYATVGRLGNDIASASNLALGGDKKRQEKLADGALDILLVGTDSRTDAQGNPLSEEELARLNAGVADGEENTDTMMIVRVPADGSKATAVSIPRDTYVKDPEFGNMKINGVYGAHKQHKAEELAAQGASEKEIAEQSIQAGRTGLITALSRLTGVDVDHYAEVGLNGFVLLTDAVGGVDVCLNQAVDDPYSGAQFDAGRQSLDGHQALAFVRQRHGLPRGDLDRIVRQQAFMASLVNKVLSTGTLTNPSKLSNMADAVERSVVIDEGWDIASFATQLSDLAGGNVTFSTIPVTSVDGVGDYGESIITVDPEEVHNFFDDLVVDKEEAAAASKSPAEDAPADAPAEASDALRGVEVHVLNAGSTSGMAGGVGSWLKEHGVKVAEVANAQPGLYSTSQVLAADPSSPAAQELAQQLGGLEVVANASLDASTIIVVTHDGYSGPTSAQEPVDAADATTASASPSETVGTPGADFGAAEVSPEINAGGNGPRCVN